jgi:hypothetical protein
MGAVWKTALRTGKTYEQLLTALHIKICKQFIIQQSHSQKTLLSSVHYSVKLT